jgi:hypothetical protein
MMTRITLYPVRLLRFHEPCSAAKMLPEYRRELLPGVER